MAFVGKEKNILIGWIEFYFGKYYNDTGLVTALLHCARIYIENIPVLSEQKSVISKPFDKTSGVRLRICVNVIILLTTGFVLYPLLFLVYIDNITQTANVTSVNKNKFNNLLFADYQVLNSKDGKLFQ
jgi:hypothetical protein